MLTNEIFQRMIEGYGSKETVSEYDALVQLLFSNWLVRLVYAAAELGIADLLKDGPKSIEDLAQGSNSNPQALYRVMRGLAAYGIFAEKADKHFELTSLAEYLRADHPRSLRSPAIFTGFVGYRSWGDIVYSVQTGKIGFDHLFGQEVFRYLSDPSNAQMAGHFNNTMIGLWSLVASSVATTYDFAQFNKIIDIGGNHGLLLASILHTYPSTQAILFDLPPVIERSQPHFAQMGFGERCQLVGGNFFESVPSGDAYLLSNVIHDWDDEKSIAILSNCRKAINPGGKILLIEQVIESDNKPFLGKLMDIEMLVITGGRERSASEYSALFKAAGFELTNVIPTKGLASIIEGCPF